MNGNKIVFDTCAVILLLKGRLKLSSLNIDIDKALQYISVITKIEAVLITNDPHLLHLSLPGYKVKNVEIKMGA